MADETDFQLQNSLQAIEYGRETVRAGILINGGAAVALLGLLGSSVEPVNSAAIMSALQLFSYGVLAAAIAAAVGYFAQTTFAGWNRARLEAARADAIGRLTQEHLRRCTWLIWRARILTLVAVALVVASFVCFYCGVQDAGIAVFG